MEFVEIGTVTVMREYRRGRYDGEHGEQLDCFELKRDCGFGCKCEARRFGTRPPTLENVIDEVLCFNDATKQGISGKGCSGRIIKQGPDVWIYEVDAKLKEGKP